jgi:hypothetical protein
MNGRSRNALDYGICVFGVLSSILFLGPFEKVSPSILFFSGVFSLGLVLLSGFSLVGGVLFNSPRHAEWHIYLIQLLCNLAPSANFVMGYASKTQVLTPPGCC